MVAGSGLCELFETTSRRNFSLFGRVETVQEYVRPDFTSRALGAILNCSLPKGKPPSSSRCPRRVIFQVVGGGGGSRSRHGASAPDGVYGQVGPGDTIPQGCPREGAASLPHCVVGRGHGTIGGEPPSYFFLRLPRAVFRED